MQSNCVIRISDDFTAYPIGRHSKDGPHSGERLREEFIKPMLQRCNLITIILDGVKFPYAPSFLDEAFAGLIRDKTLDLASFNQRIKLISNDDSSYIEEILDYVTKSHQYAAK